MRKFWNIAAAFLFLAGVLCMGRAHEERRPYEEAAGSYMTLQKMVVSHDTENPLARTIDFYALRKINPDIAAWIYVPGTNIDYPVLIGQTDEQYLDHNFEGKKSAPGAVFAFADTARDFQDAHLCLFGHNMRAPQMFGELKRYKKEAFAREHQKLYCYTPEGVKEYRLFSVYECEKTDIVFEHKMQENSGEFFRLYERMKANNRVSLPKEMRDIQPADKQIITLSCCSDYRRTVNRVTAHFIS